MKAWIRRTALGALVLGLLGAAAVVTSLQLAERRAQRQLDVAVTAVPLRDDAAARGRGHYLYTSRGCADCHGADGAGRVFVDSGGIRLAGPNISPGPGSVVAGYRPQDWVRTLRHGVKPDGRPVRVMPSEDYNRLTDDDLASLVAHVRHLAPATGGAAVLQLPLPARVLYGLGVLKDAADKIDHRLPPATPVPEGVTVEHGRYVAQMCIGCHGARLVGGRIPGSPPDWPAAARLVPGDGNAMDRYPDAASLRRMFDSGRRPDGSAVAVMPFEALRHLSDTDLRALHLYLKSQPPA